MIERTNLRLEIFCSDEAAVDAVLEKVRQKFPELEPSLKTKCIHLRRTITYKQVIQGNTRKMGENQYEVVNYLLVQEIPSGRRELLQEWIVATFEASKENHLVFRLEVAYPDEHCRSATTEIELAAALDWFLDKPSQGEEK